MILERVAIVGFRGIQRMELELHPRLNVLIGGNGCGKTTVLDGIGVGLDYAVTSLYNKLMKDKLDVRFEFSENDTNKYIEHNQVSIHLQSKDSFYNISYFSITNKKQYDGNLEMETQFPIIRYFSTSRVFSKYEKSYEYEEYDEKKEKMSAWIGIFGKKNFSYFKNWFQSQSISEALEHSRRKSFDFQLPTLQAVRAAVRSMIPGCQNIWLGGSPPEIMVQMEGEPEMSLVELSDGYRTLLALVADLAQRMVVGNPQLGLESEAIVLIDEIDLHLHPRWQQTVLSSLLKTFPRAQFIVTTHAAPIIATVQPENLICLERGPEGVRVVEAAAGYGALPDRIMEDLMGVPARPPEVTEKLTAYFRLIEAGQGESAEGVAVRRWLEEQFRTLDPDLIRADIAIRRKKLQGARPG